VVAADGGGGRDFLLVVRRRRRRRRRPVEVGVFPAASAVRAVRIGDGVAGRARWS